MAKRKIVKTPKPLPESDPYIKRTFNPATVERKKQIESLLRKGESRQQIYERIKGSGPGSRKQDVLDYTRFLQRQQETVIAIQASDKKTVEVLPMGVTYQSKQYKYIVTGIAKKGRQSPFEFGVTVNSDTPLTQSQIEANAMRLVGSNPEHYVNKEDQDVISESGKTNFNKINISQAFSKNPDALQRVIQQQDRNMKYRNKQRKERK